MISTANIGLKLLIPAFAGSPHSELVAIASRDLGKAKEAARTYNIPKAYGSYDDLINDPHIDALYNPVPNHLHVPLTLQATRAGKHVLCEKPIAITAKEAEQLRQCRRTGWCSKPSWCDSTPSGTGRAKSCAAGKSAN